MQTNLLMNVLMMSPGGMGLTPPSNPLLGAQSAIAQQGKTIGEFAGLLGQPGKQSDLALTNNPTGDIEASPQALDIAPLGLPGLANYIDQAAVLKNTVQAQTNSDTILDSKKTNIGAQVLANLNSKANIANNAAAVASDVVNEQDFQQALKNLEAQKQPDGKIVLPELPADMKAVSDADVQDLMTKAAANLAQSANSADKKTQDTANNGITTATVATGTKKPADKIVLPEAPATNVQTGKSQEAETAALTEETGTLKTDHLALKEGFKEDKTVKLETTDGTAGIHRSHDIQGHIREVKIEPKAENAALAKSAADQVEVKISQMIKDGVDMVRIKLHPEDLGKIDIQMDVNDDGKTSIRIVADRVETLEMLRRDSSSLERALKDTGVRTDAGSLQFSLRDQNQQQQQNNFAGNSNGGRHYHNAQVNDNYLKAASVNEYILTMNPQKDGLNILA